MRENESITLKPGKMLFGRVAAKLSIPNNCAGKISGRSSFSRFGLGIHCTGDYINPGYRGHMPLQLYNYGLNPIKLFPYIPICQLKLVALTHTPDTVYGETDLESKYSDDDGGPSFWWRDNRIKLLQKIFTQKSISAYVQDELLKKIGVQEPEIIERFEKFVSRIPEGEMDNHINLLERFAKKEDWRQFRHRFGKFISKSLLIPLLLLSIKMGYDYSKDPQNIKWAIVIWIATAISFFPFFWAFKMPTKQFFNSNTLRHLQ